MKDVKIDPEFRALVFSLAEAEATMLEESLLAEGCRDALVTWKGLLLDGHHRLEICRRHGIKFETKEVELEDRTAAKVWVIRNQFARRNLTPFQRAELALKLEPLIAEQAKKRMLAGKKIDPVEILPQGKTRDRLGKIAGVSGRTIDVVKEIIKKGSEEQKELLRKNSEKLFHVAGEIKLKEIKEKYEKEKEEVKKQRENAPLGENGWKVQFYKDKWGNKWLHETKEEDLITGDARSKFAHWWRDKIIKYNPKYKEAEEGQAASDLAYLLHEIIQDLEGATKALEKVRKKHGLEKIKAAYAFDGGGPRQGWDKWGDDSGFIITPGPAPEPANIEEAKRYFYPEIKSIYKKLKVLMEHLGFDEE